MTSYIQHSPAGSARHAGAFYSETPDNNRHDALCECSCPPSVLGSSRAKYVAPRQPGEGKAGTNSHGGGLTPSAMHSDGGAERRENAPSYSRVALNALRLIDARQRRQIDAARRAHRPTAHLLRALRATTHALMKAEGAV